MLVPLSLLMTDYSLADETAIADNFTKALVQLQLKSYKEKEQAIEQLVVTKDLRVKSILQAMLNARLFFTKVNKQLVIGVKNQNGFAITDVLTQKELGM